MASMAAPPARSGSSGTGIVAELKARLGPAGFDLLKSISLRYQRGEASAEEYYELSLDVLQGDADSLMRLVAKLPDAAKREAVECCHAAAVAAMEDQMLLEAQLAWLQAAQAEAVPAGAARQRSSSGGAQREDSSGCNSEDASAGAAPAAADPAAAAAAAQLLHSNVYVDEDDDEEEGWEVAARQGHSGGSGARRRGLAGNRLWVNADGQQLGQVVTQFMPPWRSGNSGSGGGQRPTYKQLSAARQRQRDGGAGAGAAPAVLPTSTPWVRPDQVAHSRHSKAVGAAVAASLAALSLHGPRLPCAADARAHRPVIVWLRRDMRLADHPALHYAASTGRPVLPVFIWAPQEYGKWPPGGASLYWLHHSLASLDAELQARYGPAAQLRCFDARHASSAQVLCDLVQATGAAEVAFNRLYEPWLLSRDAEVELALTGRSQLADTALLPYHRRPSSTLSAAAAAGAAVLGVAVKSFNGSLMYEPWEVAPDKPDEMGWYGGYGSVGFFLGSCQKLGPPAEPLAAPERLATLPPGAAASLPHACTLAALGLADLPSVGPQLAQRTGRPRGTHDWAAGIRATWRFGEAGAAAALEDFLEEGLHHFESRSQAKTIQSQRYEEEDDVAASSGGGGGRRGRPPAAPSERFRADKRYTARISPYMAWGELSPRQVYYATLLRHGPRRTRTFLRRLAWRDLAYWGLWRYPWLGEHPLRPQYDSQPWALGWRGEAELASLHSRFRRWRPDDPHLLAWQRGQTGFPLVDAGMRELWATGYCPNYVRHILAGFLIEFLNIDWRHGCLWFHDTLVDADVAINAMMWQNGGHSGMDQWNFVMHPVHAAKAADPEGDYVRRWCPELARLPVPYVHAPWEAPATTLAAAGVTLGRQYPRRIITDLDAARRASLAAVVGMRRTPEGRKYVLPDGNDALPLPDGRFARAITRVDYRQMAEQPVTKQAAADLWDKSKRPLRDPMAVAMQEALRGSLGPAKATGGRGLG